MLETIDLPNLRSARETAQFCRELSSHRLIDYEAMLAEGYSRFVTSGMTAIDIGAHAGLHYSKLKRLVGPQGRVIGFEPLPNFADHIVERHGGDAEILRKALSVEPGRSTFLYMENAPGESGFKERTYGGGRGTVELEVEISTLDLELPDLAECAFIKVDTEGHEISALSGGERLIARTRPVIAIEYGAPTYSLYGHTADSLFDFAGERGYTISDLFGNLIRDRDEWHAACDVSYWDYFMVPDEACAWWSGLFADSPTEVLVAARG